MRLVPQIFAGLLLCSTLAQGSDCAFVTRSGNTITLIADSWDPVRATGRTLADLYGVRVSVEAPKWAFPIDTEDVAAADPEWSAQHHNAHYRIMKRHFLQLQFLNVGNGTPNNVPSLLRQLADAANKEMPYAYRLDAQDDEYVLVPTKTRNSLGDLEDVQPLLDHHVTITSGIRSIAEHANLMATQLAEQTGLHIGCCQSLAGGFPGV